MPRIMSVLSLTHQIKILNISCHSPLSVVHVLNKVHISESFFIANASLFISIVVSDDGKFLWQPKAAQLNRDWFERNVNSFNRL